MHLLHLRVQRTVAGLKISLLGADLRPLRPKIAHHLRVQRRPHVAAAAAVRDLRPGGGEQGVLLRLIGPRGGDLLIEGGDLLLGHGGALGAHQVVRHLILLDRRIGALDIVAKRIQAAVQPGAGGCG